MKINRDCFVSISIDISLSTKRRSSLLPRLYDHFLKKNWTMLSLHPIQNSLTHVMDMSWGFNKY